jgi:uncharacterized protein (TIGR02118 family)
MMIAALSLMKRRPDLSEAQFRRHWLDPHGVMTAELPGVRHYVQSHFIDSPHNNALARDLDIGGMPELLFDSYDDRKIAYTSKRIAECNVDSEQFVGAVTRIVTEPVVIVSGPQLEPVAIKQDAPVGSRIAIKAPAQPPKVVLLAIGAADVAWADSTLAHVMTLTGVTGYVRHNILEQAAAPNSKIPELELAIAGVAEITFDTPETLAHHAATLAGSDGRTALYVTEDYVLR